MKGEEVALPEHPIGEHSQQLANHERRLDLLENSVSTLQAFKCTAEEQSKTIFHILGELKTMLRQYTEDMKEALKDLAQVMTTKFEKVDTEIAEVKARPGRRWDTMVQILMTVLISLLGGYLIGKIL